MREDTRPRDPYLPTHDIEIPLEGHRGGGADHATNWEQLRSIHQQSNRMKRSSPRMIATGLLAVIAIAACRTVTRKAVPEDIRPGTREEASRLPTSEVKADGARRRYTEADVRFMRGMIGHHAQALAMTALVPARTGRVDMRLLAQRIEVSQQDEIALMRRWLQDRHEEVPSLAAHHEHQDMAGHQMLMPGMLTEAELAQMAQTTGPEFDRLFLRFMIRHHEGALTMVSTLLDSQGAAQEPEVFRFASDVDTDQRAEIGRMRAMLDALPAGAPPR